MACTNEKIDSNVVGLSAALEECPGILPTTPDWKELQPNTYDQFGGTTTLVARNPINKGRQRKKGVITDLDAQAGFEMDWTHENMDDLLPGFMFADFRTKTSYTETGAAGDYTVAIETSGFPSLNTVADDFTTMGLTAGEWIFIGGDTAGSRFDSTGNNGMKRIRSVAAKKLIFDKSYTDMVADAAATKTIQLYFGRFLKNEIGALIKHKTFQFERTLGSLDGLDPPQSEYVTGCTANELTINIPTADKITNGMAFIGMKHETRTQAEGLKPGTRTPSVEGDAFNTSSDVARLNLTVLQNGEANPDKLFGYITEGTITINNNATANKAVGVLGAFAVTAGTFEVSGNVTAYFTTVEAIRAIQANADVSLDFMIRKAGKAIIVDMPLIAPGQGLANVTQDQPIMIPISTDAAEATKVDPNLNFTLGFTFFDTLPALAGSL